jgi:nucleolar protein 53
LDQFSGSFELKVAKMPVVKSSVSGSVDAPKTFNQPSRKGKKAWRKNVDVTEVEEGLEELNEQIISG